MVPQYLEASLESFQRNQSQFRDAMAGALSGGPFADLAKRNMELFAAAAGGPKPAKAESEPTPASREDEIAVLKSQLAALQAQVDKLAK
jgi:polyhydroxyalkanoate synthesis regulator protein